MLLYAFITHQAHLSQTLARVAPMMESRGLPYVVCCGGFERRDYDPSLRLLRLPCNDTYAGLPDKVFHLYQAFLEDENFLRFTHLAKLDEDMTLLQPIPGALLPDYGGVIERKPGSRCWHLGKCPGSPWNDRLYEGPFVPWALGGTGYILSKNACQAVVQTAQPSEEIYEDVMVGKALRAQGILPSWLPMRRFVVSPDH
jgi:hypothetical protein